MVVYSKETKRIRKCKRKSLPNTIYCLQHINSDINNISIGVCCFCNEPCNPCSQACGICARKISYPLRY